MSPFDQENEQHGGGSDDGSTVIAAETLKQFIRFEKKRYLERRKSRGGTAQGFRDWIGKLYSADSNIGTKFNFQGIMEAATRGWQAQPRKHGPDLFCVGLHGYGFTVPEYLTRPRGKYVTGDDIEQENEDAEDKFEKVDQQFATLSDFGEDTAIKMRKSAQASAVAARQADVFDELRRRARGKLDTPLRDLIDESAA